MKNPICFFSITFLLISSCHQRDRIVIIPDEVKARAKFIKKELKSNCCKNEDSLKSSSAYFLLEQCQAHFHYEGERIRRYSLAMNYLSIDPQIQEKQLRELDLQLSNVQDSTIYDIFQFKENQLIDHVNNTINFYEKTKWKNQIPIKVLNEYLLPYNIYKEAISPWGQYYRKVYFTDNDSTVIKVNLEDAIRIVHKWMYERTKGFIVKWGKKGLNVPEISPIALDHLRVGSCHQLTVRSTAVLRALGILS